MRTITFYSRPGCHLCDDAKLALAAAFPEVAIEEVDVDSDPRWAERYGTEIPVAMLGGQELFRQRFDLDSCQAVLNGGDHGERICG